MIIGASLLAMSMPANGVKMGASLDVLFLIRSLHIGGAGRQLALLARTMHASGHRVPRRDIYGYLWSILKLICDRPACRC